MVNCLYSIIKLKDNMTSMKTRRNIIKNCQALSLLLANHNSSLIKLSDNIKNLMIIRHKIIKDFRILSQ
jgi:hypothetical protein